MVKVEALLQKYGVTWEQALQWASTHPKWAKWMSNKRLVTRQYLLEVKNVDVKDELSLGTRLEPTAKISDLEMGKFQTVRGIVVSKIRESTYTGCPKCFKKLDATKDETCETHGEEPVELHHQTYVFVDTDDDIVLSVPPWIPGLQLLNKEILVRGALNDQLEFVANKIQIVDTDEAVVPPVQSTVQPASAVAIPAAVVQLAATQPATVSADAASAIIDEYEVKQFADIMKVFKTLSLTDAQNWHIGNHIKTSLMTLISSANCELQGTTVRVK